MKGWVRWVVLLLGGIVALALIGAGVLAFLVSRLDVRAEVEQAVEQATGRDLTISGDVGVSFYPVLGLRAENAALANVEGGRAPALAAIERLNIGVEIAPLFRRRVDVRSIVLEHPQIALEVDVEGKPNWILQPRTAPNPQPSPAPEAPPFSLREIRIVDGEFSFFDARSATGWVVSDADLTTALHSMDEPVRMQGDVTYNAERLNLDVSIAEPGAVQAGRVTPVAVTITSDILNAEFEGRTTAASGELAGNVRASGPSLRRLAAWGGAPITGGVGLERFAVSGEVGIGGGQYAFSNAGFSLDLIRGRGDFILSELRGKPYVSGRLELFDVDLNPYITGVAPPDAPTDVQPSVVAPAEAPPARPLAEIATVEAGARALDVEAPPSEVPLDLSGLHAINADLEITTAGMLFQHFQIDRSQLNLVINDGFLASTLHRLQLYGGTATGRIEIDAREPVIRIAQELNATGVDAQRFLAAAANLENIEGRAELSYNLRTAGRSQSEMTNALDGRVHIEVVSGALRGVDLGGVSRIRNALNNELISPQARTPFQGFSATFAIADGVFASDSLSFNTPDLRITGLGVFDLPQRRIDVRLAPRSTGSAIVIPFAARGPWEGIAYTSDIRDRALREIQTRVNTVEAAAR